MCHINFHLKDTINEIRHKVDVRGCRKLRADAWSAAGAPTCELLCTTGEILTSSALSVQFIKSPPLQKNTDVVRSS